MTSITNPKPLVGQYWRWSTENHIELFLITRVDNDKICGLLLYSNIDPGMVGLEVKTGLAFLHRSHNYNLWTCLL